MAPRQMDALLDVMVRFVAETVFDWLVGTVFYWPGWLALRVITLNKYPPRRGEKHSNGFVSLVGLIGLASFAVWILA